MKKSNLSFDFWEEKIITWEKSRYSWWCVFYPFAWSVKRRLKLASQFIVKQQPKNWTVVELGCGSGYLAQRLDGYLGRYLGIDISKSAIEIAKTRVRSPIFEFRNENIITFEIPKSDVVIFLGVTDWLSEQELEHLLNRLNSSYILFSYTEQKFKATWLPYLIYREFADRKIRKENYYAKTYKRQFIEDLLRKNNFSYEFISTSTLFNPGSLVWVKKNE